MTEPFSRRPRTAEEWRLRADRLKQHIDRLSIDELLRGVPLDETPHDGVGSHGHRYDPNQPRVPAGHSDGGQWTSKGGHDAGRTPPKADHAAETVVSDLGGDGFAGARFATRRGHRGPVFINGRPVQPTPGQATRLAEAEAEAGRAIARVREHDPNWRPTPSHYNTIEGMISAHRADAQQARDRFAGFQRHGIVPGPYFREGILARGPERNFYSSERQEVNRMFYTHGCHTCGTREPGTPSRNAVLDHQPPTGFNPLGRRQYLLPQCLNCSLRQGGWIRQNQNKGLR
jgi:hypothetical protein